jgi:SAM-dependent methyltransferase
MVPLQISLSIQIVPLCISTSFLTIANPSQVLFSPAVAWTEVFLNSSKIPASSSLGMDLTKFLLDKLEDFNNGRYDIPLYCADIMEHPDELNNRYDVVIGFFTLHHLQDMTACFKAMAQMIKPGGTIVFLEPNAFNPLYYVQILITPGMTWAGDGGIINMRKKVIFDSMRKAGLRDIKISRFGFFPPFITNRLWGSKLERTLERIPIWRRFLPFQLVKGQK